MPSPGFSDFHVCRRKIRPPDLLLVLSQREPVRKSPEKSKRYLRGKNLEAHILQQLEHCLTLIRQGSAVDYHIVSLQDNIVHIISLGAEGSLGFRAGAGRGFELGLLQKPVYLILAPAEEDVSLLCIGHHIVIHIGDIRDIGGAGIVADTRNRDLLMLFNGVAAGLHSRFKALKIDGRCRITAAGQAKHGQQGCQQNINSFLHRNLLFSEI